ncbi:MAG: hypothetical protein ACE5Q3_09960 [Alphaproteobacteria bacterium]
MAKAFVNALFGVLLACSLMAYSGPSAAGHLGQTQTADGMDIYLGLVPAAALRQSPDRYPGHEQGKIPSGKHVYHVMLALFDRSSGQRITDAIINARAAPLGLGGPQRHLDPTLVAGVITYCNYFRISPLDISVIEAEIRRPNVSRATRVRFVLEPHRE